MNRGCPSTTLRVVPLATRCAAVFASPRGGRILGSAGQQRLQVGAGEGLGVLRHLFRRPFGHDFAAAHAALWLRHAFGSGPEELTSAGQERGKVLAGERAKVASDVLRRTLSDNLPAPDSAFGP